MQDIQNKIQNEELNQNMFLYKVDSDFYNLFKQNYGNIVNNHLQLFDILLSYFGFSSDNNNHKVFLSIINDESELKALFSHSITLHKSYNIIKPEEIALLKNSLISITYPYSEIFEFFKTLLSINNLKAEIAIYEVKTKNVYIII